MSHGKIASASQVPHTINLEDDREASRFLKELKFKQLFGAYLKGDDKLAYTSDSRDWFDLSLISTYGREEADRLKLLNRRTYQELIFEGLGLGFGGEPHTICRQHGRLVCKERWLSPALLSKSWPMKKWAYHDELKKKLESAGLRVNVLESRPTNRRTYLA